MKWIELDSFSTNLHRTRSKTFFWIGLETDFGMARIRLEPFQTNPKLFQISFDANRFNINLTQSESI